MVKRFLDSLDSEDVIRDVHEKKALPELILKQNILEAEDLMLMSERKMMLNYRLYKRHARRDVVEFEGNIVLLFGFIKQMIKEKLLKEDNQVFNELVQLEIGKEFDVTRLFVFKNFLLKYLHSINITNLFQASTKGWEEEIDNEY